MQQLRILTGRHAGSQIRLKRHRHVIGNDDDADIRITDWQGPPMRLVLEDSGSATLMPASTPDGVSARPTAPLEDFIPRRLHDIVVCIGPADACWPSDIELMSRVLAHQALGSGPPGRSRRKAMWGGAIAGAALLAAFAALTLRIAGNAEAHEPQVAMVDQVRQALAKPGLESLTVREAGRRVLVEGLLPDAPSVARAHGLLHRFSDGNVIRHYTAASNLVQSITEALGNPALSVSYEGQGVFKVHGAVVEPALLAQSTRRIASDLAPLVARIDIGVAELPAPSRAKVGSVMSGTEISYVQTSDGVKHLTMVDVPEGASTDASQPHPATLSEKP